MSQVQEQKRLLTAEYVSPMHPDRMCDIISEGILDLFLEIDPESICDIKTSMGDGRIVIFGEIFTRASTAHLSIRNKVKEILGYKEFNFSTISIDLTVKTTRAKSLISEGVCDDSAICVGYACSENKSMVPHEFFLAKSLCDFLYKKNPDSGKVQITIDTKLNLETIVIIWNDLDKEKIKEYFLEWQGENAVKMGKGVNLYFNVNLDKTIDNSITSGASGRRLSSEFYGMRIPTTSTGFSGKSGNRVERFGSLSCRHIALEILKSNKEVKNVLVKLVYAIGSDTPIMATAEINGNAPINFKFESGELSPKVIMKKFELGRPIYLDLSTNGFFEGYGKWNNPTIQTAEVEKTNLKKDSKETGLKEVPKENVQTKK